MEVSWNRCIQAPTLQGLQKANELLLLGRCQKVCGGHTHASWDGWGLCKEAPWGPKINNWVCLKIGYIPNEIAIFHRDNDQQNHWVQWGTNHFQTHPIMIIIGRWFLRNELSSPSFQGTSNWSFDWKTPSFFTIKHGKVEGFHQRKWEPSKWGET